MQTQFQHLAEAARRMGLEASFEAECQRVIGRKDLTLCEMINAARVIVWSLETEQDWEGNTKIFSEWPSMPPP